MVKLKKGETIWTRVEIDDKQLGKEIRKKKIEILDEISNRLNNSDLLIVGEGIITSSPLTIAAGVKEIHDNDPERILKLLCMSRFMDRKGRAIQEIAKTMLSGTGNIDIDDTGYMALLFVLYEKTPLSMLEVYIRNHVMNRGFDRYQLKSTKKSRPKIALNTLDEDSVNNMLKTFDKNLDDGKESDCWHVSSQGEVVELYIRREDESVMLNKLTDNTPEMLAKSTIIRFDKFGRNVDLWSEKDVIAAQMLNHISTKLFDAKSEYVPELYSNDKSDIEKMLKALIEGTDANLELLKIGRRNAPIEGSPKIVIESNTSISSALLDLKKKGIDISADSVPNIEEIRINFSNKKYVFGLVVKDSQVFVLPKGQKGTSSELVEINQHMHSKYNVRISLGR